MTSISYMSDLFNQLKSRLGIALSEIRNFKSLPDSEKNSWFGPLVIVLWALIALLIGPSVPREETSGILDLREYFSFIGGYWFLLLTILAVTTVGVLKNMWSRYVLAALVVAHVLFYVSYIPGGYGYNDGTFNRADGQISLFSGSITAALFFELIPLVGALMTVRLESAQWMRTRLARIVPAVRKWAKQSANRVDQSGDAAANRAWRASRVVEMFGWFNIVIGIIAGVILIVLGFRGGSCDNSYGECAVDGNYVGIGFGVVFACVIQGSFFVMIGAFIASRTSSRSTTV
jgi:hypothetical protein